MDTRPTADTPDRGLAVAGPSQRGIEWVPNYFNTLTPPPRPAPIGDSVEWPISDIRPRESSSRRAMSDIDCLVRPMRAHQSPPNPPERLGFAAGGSVRGSEHVDGMYRDPVEPRQPTATDSPVDERKRDLLDGAGRPPIVDEPPGTRSQYGLGHDRSLKFGHGDTPPGSRSHNHDGRPRTSERRL